MIRTATALLLLCGCGSALEPPVRCPADRDIDSCLFSNDPGWVIDGLLHLGGSPELLAETHRRERLRELARGRDQKLARVARTTAHVAGDIPLLDMLVRESVAPANAASRCRDLGPSDPEVQQWPECATYYHLKHRCTRDPHPACADWSFPPTADQAPPND